MVGVQLPTLRYAFEYPGLLLYGVDGILERMVRCGILLVIQQNCYFQCELPQSYLYGVKSQSPQPENFWYSVSGLVHFGAGWWQLYVGRRSRYICNFAIKIEPICQLQYLSDCTVVLLLLSSEHASTQLHI